MLRRCRRNSLIWFAPPCSSWVWVNRHTASRSRAIPLGNCSLPHVRDANECVSKPRAGSTGALVNERSLVLAHASITHASREHVASLVRVVLLMEYCLFKGLAYAIEQPLSSLLHLHPRMQALMGKPTVPCLHAARPHARSSDQTTPLRTSVLHARFHRRRCSGCLSASATSVPQQRNLRCSSPTSVGWAIWPTGQHRPKAWLQRQRWCASTQMPPAASAWWERSG